MQKVTIQGKVFDLAPRYKAGDTLGENEAAALNQTFFENIRNNFARTIKSAEEAAANGGAAVNDEALQSELNKYAAEYKFGVRIGGGGAPRDPVGKAARFIARERIESLLKQRGHTIKEVGRKRVNELVEGLLAHEKHGPEIAKLAKQRVAAAEKIAVDLADLDLDS